MMSALVRPCLLSRYTQLKRVKLLHVATVSQVVCLSGLQLATVYSRQTTHRASPKFRSNNSVFGLFTADNVPCPVVRLTQRTTNNSSSEGEISSDLSLPKPSPIPFLSATTKSSTAAAVSVTSVNTVSRVGRSLGSLQPVHHHITSLAFQSFAGSRAGSHQHPLSRSP